MARAGGDARLQSRVRIAGAGVFLFLIVIYVSGEVFQLPFLRTTFHIEPTILGILVGAFTVLVGVEVLSRLPGIAQGIQDDPPRRDKDDAE